MKAAGLPAVRAGTLVLAACIGAQPLARAGMIGAEAAAVAASGDADRTRVQELVDRAAVTERLQALGVSEQAARERIAALTDAEAHALAERMDALPAGGALSQQDWILILLLVILLIVAL